MCLLTTNFCKTNQENVLVHNKTIAKEIFKEEIQCIVIYFFYILFNIKDMARGEKIEEMLNTRQTTLAVLPHNCINLKYSIMIILILYQ